MLLCNNIVRTDAPAGYRPLYPKLFTEVKPLGSLSSKKVFIFDMDGTIYLGSAVFEKAVRFIKRLRSDGRKVVFFTNNSSHSGEFYLKKLDLMGFSPDRDEIMTSGDVTIDFLKKNREGRRVYLLGNSELRSDFEKAGIDLSCTDPSEADIVVSAFDTELDYGRLTFACRAIDLGAEFLSTHPDFRCPTEDGFIPDSGAICAAITAATGARPVFFGKPYEQTVLFIGERTGAERGDICIFGDRLYTDIAFGKKHGITSVLVMTGETTEDDLKNVGDAQKPDIVFEDMGRAEEDVFVD